ncbi:MAG: LCP family protein [Propionibacteriaceae bacterium]|jgi:LCP family protein required for cell wall assembly|nr:LCP family protein [Propionibacteriaceae bacterium]
MLDDAPSSANLLESGDAALIEPPEEPQAAAQSESQAAKKKRRWWIPLCLSLSLLLVAAGCVTGWGWYTLNSALDKITRDPALVVDRAGYTPAPETAQGPLNIVIMGSDARSEDEDGRSDVLLIAHFNAARDKLYLISLPRDLYVDIPNFGMNKINAAYALGGSPLVIATLQELLGIGTDHTVVIDFEGFIAATEAIGGVTFNNRIESASKGYTFPKGKITLEGKALLAYVQQRKGLPDGDLDRTERHRTVLRAIFLKIATPQTLTNPEAMMSLANNVGGYLTVDSRLTNGEIIRLASTLHIDAGEDIVSLQAPVAAFERNEAGAVDIVHEERMAELATAVQDDTLDEYVNRYGTGTGLTQ